MQQCPKCQSNDIRRSRSRGSWEIWRKQVTSKRPHRCNVCGWRGWGPFEPLVQPPSTRPCPLVRFDEPGFTDEDPLRQLDRFDLDKVNRLRP